MYVDAGRLRGERRCLGECDYVPHFRQTLLALGPCVPPSMFDLVLEGIKTSRLVGEAKQVLRGSRGGNKLLNDESPVQYASSFKQRFKGPPSESINDSSIFELNSGCIFE